ncbi:MAG TPA: hypothetical protein VII06_35490 [Chloroflexota bacterium]
MLSAESLPLVSWRESIASRVRVWEVVGWAAVLAVAAVLRLASLGDRPLGPDEAQPALAAWRMWLQNPPSDAAGGVLLLHLLAASFGLAGASDLVARLPTVAAGLALVGAPWLLRPLMGPAAALASGSLLALSPMLVFGSRHVDSAILVPAVLAWLVGVSARALLGATDTIAGDRGTPSPQPSPRGRGGLVDSAIAVPLDTEDTAQPGAASEMASRSTWRRWAYAAAVLLALLFTAGSVVVPALLAVLGAAVVTWWPTRRPADALGLRAEAPSQASEREGQGAGLEGRSASSAAGADAPAVGTAGGRGDSANETARWRLPRPGDWLAAVALQPRDWQIMGALFAGTLVLAGTAGFMDLRGLQGALVEPWVSWLAPYYPRTVAIPWLPTLLVYDLPIAVAAIAGIAVVVKRNRPFEHFLLWWTTLAALPLVFQPPDPLPYLLCWLVPLALLGGLALASLVPTTWTWRGLGEDTVLAALVGVTFVCLVNTLRLIQTSLGGPTNLAARGREVALSVLVLVFLGYVHWHLRGWWRGGDAPGAAARPTRVGAVIAVALGLAFVVVANGRLQFANYGAGGPELLRPVALSPGIYELVDDLQAWARQENSSPIIVSETLQPLLLWHLRDVPTVRFQHDFPDAGVQVTGQVRRGVWPAGPGAPDGERMPLDETIAVGPIPSAGALWNWWLYRNAWLVPTRHDIIVVR